MLTLNSRYLPVQVMTGEQAGSLSILSKNCHSNTGPDKKICFKACQKDYVLRSHDPTKIYVKKHKEVEEI